ARAPRLVRDLRAGAQHRHPRPHRLPHPGIGRGTRDAGRRQPAPRPAARPDERAVTATTIAALLDERSGDDTPGLVVDDRGWTWRAVVAECDRWAAALESLRPADGPFHVGLLMGNQPEYLFALLGAARIGAVVVGINDTRRGEELARDIRHTDCVAVLCDAS